MSYYGKSAPFPTRIILFPGNQKDFVFAVKKGNTGLVNKINSGLKKVKADGTYGRLVEKWFGKQQN